MSTSKDQAIKRFEKLWEIEGDKLRRGDIIPSEMKNGVIYPVDYCISTIARLLNQPFGDHLVCRIRGTLSALLKAADMQYVYPDESLHVSLLGCTQRVETINQFDREHINKIKEICQQEIEKAEPAEMILRGIGIAGNQIFIQGIPVNRNWEELRTSMTDRLVQSGENPIAYEDKSPVHINIIRIINADRDLLTSLHKEILKLRDVELGSIKLTCIQYVITDFCVSQKNVVWLDKLTLNYKN